MLNGRFAGIWGGPSLIGSLKIFLGAIFGELAIKGIREKGGEKEGEGEGEGEGKEEEEEEEE